MKQILHCDLNNFFASAECLAHPEYRDKPLAVCGSVKDRRGIVLAKNYLAKSYGVFTGQTYRDAEKCCPGIVILEPHFDLYLKYSKMVRNIYLQYTDLVEPLGIDEAWLDVTHSKLFGTAEHLANEIRERVHHETGLTISVGVSFNKVFAKLGSDLKKPNATTIISEQNFKQIVWPLDIEELYGIGDRLAVKLRKIGINKVGELAKLEADYLISRFGKIGQVLHDFANGTGDYPVKNYYEADPPKSVGNSTTSYKDLETQEEIKQVLMMLVDNVVTRCLSYGIQKAHTMSMYVKDSDFKHYSKQCACNFVINSNELFELAYQFYLKNFSTISKVRSLGVSVSGFENDVMQLDMFSIKSQKMMCLDETVKFLKFKFGENAIMRGTSILDKRFHRKFHN